MTAPSSGTGRPPTAIVLLGDTVSENLAGAVIGELMATDPDPADTHVFTVSDPRFEVVDVALRLRAGVSLDHEAEPEVLLDVTATDPAGLSFTQQVRVLVGNVSETLRGGAGAEVLRGAEVLLGRGGNDTLIGAAGGDRLDGGLGADRMEGGAGDDTYIVDAAGDVVVEAPGGGHDRVIAALSWTLGAEVEWLTLSGTADLDGTGNALANRIDGNAGANLLDGGEGNDRLYGQAGEDRLLGGGGADRLDGGLGADRMEGGAGDDSYIVDDADDAVVEAPGGGYDRVFASLDWALGAEVERLTLTGSADLDGTGNALANRLDGNAGANLLDGAEGDDLLFGGAGADTLLGGEGNDRLQGGAGDDSLDGGAGFDRARYDGAQSGYRIHGNADGSFTVTDIDAGNGDMGRDVLRDIERLDFSDGSAPLARADRLSTHEDAGRGGQAAFTFTAAELLANDSGGGLRITGVDVTGLEGELTWQTDAEGFVTGFTYTPTPDAVPSFVWRNPSDITKASPAYITDVDPFQALAPGQTRTTSFTYTAVDATGREVSATVELDVAGVNDRPVVRSVHEYHTRPAGDSGDRYFLTLPVAVDLDSDVFAFGIKDLPVSGFLDLLEVTSYLIDDPRDPDFGQILPDPPNPHAGTIWWQNGAKATGSLDTEIHGYIYRSFSSSFFGTDSFTYVATDDRTLLTYSEAGTIRLTISEGMGLLPPSVVLIV